MERLRGRFVAIGLLLFWLCAAAQELPTDESDRKRIYVTSGEGYIFVYRQIDPDRYERIAKIPTTIGARTSANTGQVGKHNSFYLAVPARADRGAELWVYETRD